MLDHIAAGGVPPTRHLSPLHQIAPSADVLAPVDREQLYVPHLRLCSEFGSDPESCVAADRHRREHLQFNVASIHDSDGERGGADFPPKKVSEHLFEGRYGGADDQE
jgi:hypothetical protein